MEKYYKVKEEIAVRGGFTPLLRAKTDCGCLLLSERDLRMISLTLDEKLGALGAVEYDEEAHFGDDPVDDPVDETEDPDESEEIPVDEEGEESPDEEEPVNE
mgnify:CR=1 FL=1